MSSQGWISDLLATHYTMHQHFSYSLTENSSVNHNRHNTRLFNPRKYQLLLHGVMHHLADMQQISNGLRLQFAKARAVAMVSDRPWLGLVTGQWLGLVTGQWLGLVTGQWLGLVTGQWLGLVTGQWLGLVTGQWLGLVTGQWLGLVTGRG